MATILIVDDDSTTRMMCAGMLSAHDCVEAEHGESALTQLNAHTFDLLLTDLEMPVMNGLELIHEIRRSYKDLPIVVMTGCDAEDLRQEALDAGAQAILGKPFGLDRLITTLNPLL